MRKSPVWIALLLFALPVVGSQFLGLWFAKPMAFHLLEEKVAELKGAMAVRHRELDAAINKQLAQFEFKCGAKDMELLRDPRFYSAHIRLQGLELASGKSCSSLGVEIPLIKELQNSGQKFGKLGITATVAKYNTEQELVAFYRSGGNLAYWVLDNSWSHDLLQHPCSHCFYLEFSRQDTDASTVHFPRGDKEIKQEESNISLSFFDPNELTKQTVWAGKALEQYAHDQLNHYGLWFGIALGALLSVTYWLLRSYRRSLKGLLQTGLIRKEFIPLYQPIVDARTHQVVGFEALLRWQRGNELIPPGAFIDYAEEQDLILPMTSQQLLEKVIADLPLARTQISGSASIIVAAHLEQSHLLRTLLAQQPSMALSCPAHLRTDRAQAHYRHRGRKQPDLRCCNKWVITSSWMTSGPATVALPTCRA